MNISFLQVANLMELGEDDSDEDYDSEGEIDSQDGSLNGSHGKIKID